MSPKVEIVKGPLSRGRHFTLVILTHPATAGAAMRGSVAADFARIGRYRTTAIPAFHDGSGARLHALIMHSPKGSIAVHKSTFPWLAATLQVGFKLDKRLKSTTTTISAKHPHAENTAVPTGPYRASIRDEMKPGADMPMKTTTRLCVRQSPSQRYPNASASARKPSTTCFVVKPFRTFVTAAVL
jgi:hypothetical protein